MILSNISFSNFRNLLNLQVDLNAGLTIISADNGQGKSTFLEGAYLLAIGKSYKANTEKELVNWDAAQKELAVISGKLVQDDSTIDIKVGIDTRQSTLQKYARVNSVPKRPSEIVGIMNAVLFSAEDIELILGPPQFRRRYLDILIAQINNKYLRALQQYQKIVTQRNRVLRNIRDGSSKFNELELWNSQLCKEGALVISSRVKILEDLNMAVASMYDQLSPESTHLDVCYLSTVPYAVSDTLKDIEESFLSALVDVHSKEMATFQTAIGPHRDDIQLSQNGRDFGKFASRGQARIAALSMRLAEAKVLRKMKGHDPILLLDDLLSELDFEKRQLVMDEINRYQQTILSTAEIDIVPQNSIRDLKILELKQGLIQTIIQ